MTTVSSILGSSDVNFGTSGLRGLVEALTNDVLSAITVGFIGHMADKFDVQPGSEILLAHDLRPSSPEFSRAIANVVTTLGYKVGFAGAIPTPALALASLSKSVPAIMVTGSHIPFDRNGIKFYTPFGEILKDDEIAISSSNAGLPDHVSDGLLPAVDDSVRQAYIARYTKPFSGLLAGQRIGLYQHSAVGRDLNREIFEDLGAEVICLGRSDEFVPIDTEAVSEADKQRGKRWAAGHGLAAVISTDGDGDRPLLADETGEFFQGDALGTLAARSVKADIVVTPVSSSSVVEGTGWFKDAVRTKIGSPYVLAAMDQKKGRGLGVVGFEANGGFMTQSELEIGGFKLSPLPTRDAILPVLAAFVLAQKQSKTLAQIRDLLPARYNRSDRLEDQPSDRSRQLIEEMATSDKLKARVLGPGVSVVRQDDLDGLRLWTGQDEIVHIRPSGNAPELRVYVESGSPDRADKLLADVKMRLEKILS